jgi:hypothetical protein
MKLAPDHDPYEFSKTSGKENELTLGLSTSTSGALKRRSRETSARKQGSDKKFSNVLGLAKAGKLQGNHQLKNQTFGSKRSSKGGSMTR